MNCEELKVELMQSLLVISGVTVIFIWYMASCDIFSVENCTSNILNRINSSKIIISLAFYQMIELFHNLNSIVATGRFSIQKTRNLLRMECHQIEAN